MIETPLMRDAHVADFILSSRYSDKKRLHEIFSKGNPFEICRGLHALLEQHVLSDDVWFEQENGQEIFHDNNRLSFACEKFAYTGVYGITPKHVDAVGNILSREHKDSPVLLRRINVLVTLVKDAMEIQKGVSHITELAAPTKVTPSTTEELTR